MSSKYINLLPQLRKNIPIGLSYGLKLLEETNGDIDSASSLFKAKLIDTLMRKEDITFDAAEIALQTCHFEIDKALRLIRENKYSLTERILKSKGKKEDILDNIALAIENNSKLKSDFWIIEKELARLSDNEFTFMIIWQWIQFSEWEGIDIAIDLNYTDRVINELRKALTFHSLADAIAGAKKRKEEYKINFPNTNTIEGYCDFMNSLALDKEYNSYTNQITANQDILIDKLYHFVSQHKATFPK